MKQSPFDARRTIIIPGKKEETLAFAANHWIECGQKAISDHGYFAAALSGGSTPKLIYERIVTQKSKLDWGKVFLFWSDERAVPPDDTESNFHMAMVEGKLNQLPIPKENIFRMVAEKEIEANAIAYEKLIKEKVKTLDLTMLGMGEDGHTASLFPHTEALHMVNRLVAPNFVPQKNTWRMSFTFDCINQSKNIVLYALGAGKAEILAKVLTSPYSPDDLPSQRVGTPDHKALFILDEDASTNLLPQLK